MIEKLTNCPNCGGYLNDSGRCEFCGSKVFDFLTIDFNRREMPSAKTYIRLKVGGKTMIAPIIVGTMSMEIPSNTLEARELCGEVSYISAPAYPTFNIDFHVIGDMITIDSEDK